MLCSLWGGSINGDSQPLLMESIALGPAVGHCKLSTGLKRSIRGGHCQAQEGEMTFARPVVFKAHMSYSDSMGTAQSCRGTNEHNRTQETQQRDLTIGEGPMNSEYFVVNSVRYMQW